MLPNKNKSVKFIRFIFCVGFGLVALGLRAEEIVATGDLVLTNAAQVRELSLEAAAKSLPVRLHGVVVFEGSQSSTLVDETAGIYLEDENGRLSVFRREMRCSWKGSLTRASLRPL